MGPFDIYFKQDNLNKVGNPSLRDEEFSTEMYERVFDTTNLPPFNSYSENGIRVDRGSDRMIINYNGILAKSGAKDVFAYVGYGSNNNWGHAANYPMHISNYGGFELMIPIRGGQPINIAFKDGAGHWDNNNGNNYTFNSSFYRGSH